VYVIALAVAHARAVVCYYRVWAEIRRYHGDSNVPETTTVSANTRDSILTRPSTAGIAALEVEFRNLREVCNCYCVTAFITNCSGS
jgi:hypothetical protein